MKTYQSHKVVEAAQILGYSQELGEVTIYADNADGYERIAMPNDFFKRGTPKVGDYLVRYQPDGYLSWSPKAVFEAGYTELRELTQVDDVTVTVPAPPGKRAVVSFNRAGVGGSQTITGGQSHTFQVPPGYEVTIREGKPHSTVEQVFSPD